MDASSSRSYPIMVFSCSGAEGFIITQLYYHALLSIRSNSTKEQNSTQITLKRW